MKSDDWKKFLENTKGDTNPKRVAKNWARDIFSKRNSIRNRLTRLKDRIVEANDEVSYEIVLKIENRFDRGSRGLDEDEIKTLNVIGDKYPGI